MAVMVRLLDFCLILLQQELFRFFLVYQSLRAMKRSNHIYSMILNDVTCFLSPFKVGLYYIVFLTMVFFPNRVFPTPLSYVICWDSASSTSSTESHELYKSFMKRKLREELVIEVTWIGTTVWKVGVVSSCSSKQRLQR